MRYLPEETSPLNSKAILEPHFPIQKHEKALIVPTQLNQPHNGNIHHSHQQSLPTRKKIKIRFVRKEKSNLVK